MSTSLKFFVAMVVLLTLVSGCNRRRPPVAAPTAPPPAAAPPAIAPAPPGPAPQRVDETLPVPQQPALGEDAIANRSLDELNRDSPLQPVFFSLDSAELDEAG